MNAYTSSEELQFLPANRISYAEHYAPARPARKGLFARVAEFFQRQAAIREMADLTDHELADIGLTRADLPHMFDGNFAARRAR